MPHTDDFTVPPIVPPTPAARRRRCAECGELYRRDEPGESTCPACRRSRCGYCSYSITADQPTVTMDDILYHETCTAVCAANGCERRVTIGDADMWYVYASTTERREVRCCGDCVQQCSDCNHYFASDDGGSENSAGDWICHRCADNYFQCPGCEATCHEDDAGGSADDNELIRYCRPCYQQYQEDRTPEQRAAWERRQRAAAARLAEAERAQRREAMRRPLHFRRREVHDPLLKQVLNDYDFRPRPTFLRLPDDGKEALYLGWEIECEYPKPGPMQGPTSDRLGRDLRQLFEIESRVRPDHAMIANLQEFVYPRNELYAKRDSSIQYGAELVSHPGTWRFWKNYDWSFADKLRENRWRSYDTESCGMHVHMSRDQFTRLEQAKMVKFFRDNENLMLDLSRRRGTVNQTHYAAIDRDENIVARLLSGGDGHRYSAVNLRNEKTIEIRIFRGTLNPAGILRNLALCQAIGKFVKVASVADLSALAFFTWLSAKGSVYLGRKMGIEIAQWVSRTIAPVDTGC